MSGVWRRGSALDRYIWESSVYRWYVKPGIDETLKGVGIDREEKTPRTEPWDTCLIGRDVEKASVRKLPLRVIGRIACGDKEVCVVVIKRYL